MLVPPKCFHFTKIIIQNPAHDYKDASRLQCLIIPAREETRPGIGTIDGECRGFFTNESRHSKQVAESYDDDDDDET